MIHSQVQVKPLFFKMVVTHKICKMHLFVSFVLDVTLLKWEMVNKFERQKYYATVLACKQQFYILMQILELLSNTYLNFFSNFSPISCVTKVVPGTENSLICSHSLIAVMHDTPICTAKPHRYSLNSSIRIKLTSSLSFYLFVVFCLFSLLISLN